MQREPSREAFKVLARRLGLAGREIVAQNKSVYGHSFGVDTRRPVAVTAGDLFPRIRKDCKVGSSIPRPLG